MTTVAELIEFLEGMPANAQVYCGTEYTDGHSWHFKMSPVDLSLSESCVYCDQDQDKNLVTTMVIELRGQE